MAVALRSLKRLGKKRETEVLNDPNYHKSSIKEDNGLKKANYKAVGSVVTVIVF